MAFTSAFIKILLSLPTEEAIRRIRAAAELGGSDPNEAELDFRVLAGLPAEPRQAAKALEGIPLMEHAALITPVLKAGGKVELGLSDGQIVLHASTPVSTRQRYIFVHKGKPIDQPLLRFVRAHYPKSKAAQILQNPGRSSKTVVGAWEAIQRDPVLRRHFTRKIKNRKKDHQRAA